MIVKIKWNDLRGACEHYTFGKCIYRIKNYYKKTPDCKIKKCPLVIKDSE